MRKNNRLLPFLILIFSLLLGIFVLVSEKAIARVADEDREPRLYKGDTGCGEGGCCIGLCDESEFFDPSIRGVCFPTKAALEEILAKHIWKIPPPRDPVCGGSSGSSPTPTTPTCDANAWRPWSVCSAPCGGGRQARTNDCGTVQKQECNTQSCDISYPSLTPTPTPVGYTPTPTPLNYTPTPSPTISPSGFSPSWFKTENGDVHSNKDIIVSLPSLLERFSDFLVTVKNLSSFAARSDNDARPELASKRNWYWYSPPYGQVSYPELTGFFSYYTHNKPADKKLVVDNINNVLVNSLAGLGKPVRVQVDPTGGSVAISDSIGLSGDRQLVFYINGDLNINNNIILTDDSGIVFVVNGNLNIDASVTQADGFYLVDKVVNSSYPGNGNKPLVVHGAIFVSQEGKIFGSSRQNNDRGTPAEKIIFEPKYLVKFSQVLGRAGIVWQEVAP